MPNHLMRATALRAVALLLLLLCRTGHPLPLALDGEWSANADAMGSTLSMQLKHRGHHLTGSGTYTRGALQTGSVRVTGAVRGAIARLVLDYDNGLVARFESSRIDGERMIGRLIYPDGTVIDLTFVRP